MKVTDKEHYYFSEDQLIVDDSHSFIGGILGYLIQSAQLKKALPHQSNREVRALVQAKCDKYVAKLVNNAESTSTEELKWKIKYDAYYESSTAVNNCIHRYFTIATQEGRELDVIQIAPNIKSSDNGVEDEYYTIHFMGIGQRLGNRVIDLYREAYKNRTNVIGFDYSNVGFSTGSNISSLNRMIADGSAVISCLMQQGVPADRITLYGYSLGGLIATSLAAEYHKNNMPVTLYVASAPMDLAQCVCARLHANIPYLSNAITRLLDYFEWNVDGIALWNMIPQEYKEYSYIDVDDNATQLEDNLIPVAATITGKLRGNFDFSTETDSKLRLIRRMLASEQDATTKEQLVHYHHFLQESLNGSHHKFTLLQGLEKRANPHGSSQFLLRNAADESPETLFEDFQNFVQLNSTRAMNL